MGTFQAVAVSLVALLPGALFTWSFEREVGNWGVRLSDRLYRFFGFSVLFNAIFFYPEYIIWTNYLHKSIVVDGKPGFRDIFVEGGRLPWWLFLVPLAYVIIPTAVGFFTAKGA